MEQYLVTGMSCAACSSRVEKAVSGVPGVTSCAVSLLTNSMGVEGTASPEAVVEAVEKAGYGARIKGSEDSRSPGSAAGDGLSRRRHQGGGRRRIRRLAQGSGEEGLFRRFPFLGGRRGPEGP